MTRSDLIQDTWCAVLGDDVRDDRSIEIYENSLSAVANSHLWNVGFNELPEAARGWSQ